MNDAPLLAVEQAPERVVLKSGEHLTALTVLEGWCQLLLSSQTVALLSATDAL